MEDGSELNRCHSGKRPNWLEGEDRASSVVILRELRRVTHVFCSGSREPGVTLSH